MAQASARPFPPSPADRATVYERITAEIVTAIERGAGAWRMPWHHDGARAHERDVLFIDASRAFEAGKKQNRLREEDIAHVMRVYAGRLEEERYSHKATLEEIEDNNFNLNIPRYVDTFEPEAEIDIQAVQREIEDLERQLAESRVEMNRYLKELGVHVRG